ncbi:MAG: helix-turn-helix transcriptional regulator [Clostridia bacterium]|nr:helix-turn-helix transcriptional regulator [Clostridia bacterium]
MVDLKTRRLLIGISQTELAATAGISLSLVRKIEYGQRKPSVKVAKQIAAALGFDWTEFFKEVS